MNAIKTALVLTACCLGFGIRANDITGRVTLKGAPPPERAVDLKSHLAIAAKHPKGLTTRHYRVSSDGGLQNVLVYVRGTNAGAMPEPALRPSPILDHVDGLFQPYVMGIQVGQQLHLKCSDGTSCSFIVTPKVNQSFSIAPGHATVPRTFSQPEVPVRFKCDLHPWNYAYVGVFAHPYFAVTDEGGRFIVRGVPPGGYTLAVFHPKGGTISKSLVVADTAVAVDFEMPAK
jgi:hypothetical protein